MTDRFRAGNLRQDALRSADGPASPLNSQGISSYRQILSSSAVIAVASALTLAVGILRTKAIALLLGPGGVGLLGLYTNITDLARSLAGMGINGSGVRQIAEAAGTSDARRIALTVTVVRRIASILGCVGAIMLALLSHQISELTFGDHRHSDAVALLSLVVVFRLLADGQGALIQGLRRIGDFARVGVLGAVLGAIVSVALVYVLRQDGIVPSLVAIAAMSFVASSWYAGKVQISAQSFTSRQMAGEAASLLKLGVAFMASGLLMLGSGYAVRLLVLRNAGLDATGLYEAAWTLGGLYIGFVLQAMGTDFYPRLVGVATDNAQCNRLVNEQTQVSMLLAAPGVIVTITLAPLILTFFYSRAFVGAVEVLRWLCLGMALRVITWPMGYIIIARGRQVIFLACEIAWTIVSIGLAVPLVQAFGLVGAGIAFFGAYVFHALLIYPLVRHLSDFCWSKQNANTALLFTVTIGGVFLAFALLPTFWSYLAGGLVACGSAVYSVRTLLMLAPVHLPTRARWLLAPLLAKRTAAERHVGASSGSLLAKSRRRLLGACSRLRRVMLSGLR
jgi:PST family polysaccharide transporter